MKSDPDTRSSLNGPNPSLVVFWNAKLLFLVVCFESGVVTSSPILIFSFGSFFLASANFSVTWKSDMCFALGVRSGPTAFVLSYTIVFVLSS